MKFRLTKSTTCVNFRPLLCMVCLIDLLTYHYWKDIYLRFFNFKHDCNFSSEYTVQSNFSSPCIIANIIGSGTPSVNLLIILEWKCQKSAKKIQKILSNNLLYFFGQYLATPENCLVVKPGSILNLNVFNWKSFS